MGYRVYVRFENVAISKEFIGDALKAINKLHEHEQLVRFAHGGSWSNGRQTGWHYSWVHNPPEGGFENLKSALEEWNHLVEESEDGDLVFAEFTGEKMGDYDILYDAIAPYATGTIYYEGEDECRWKYVFADGKCKEVKAKITITYDDGEVEDLN